MGMATHSVTDTARASRRTTSATRPHAPGLGRAPRGAAGLLAQRQHATTDNLAEFGLNVRMLPWLLVRGSRNTLPWAAKEFGRK